MFSVQLCVSLHSPLFLSSLPLSLSLSVLFTDELKGDYDSMGPDANLPSVGNGTGQSRVCFICLTFLIKLMNLAIH